MTIVEKISSCMRDWKTEFCSAQGFTGYLSELGFRIPFQEYRPPWLLERWDHPDGRYGLLAYGDGGVHVSEDVNDPEWRDILDRAYNGKVPPVVFTSEDWFRLRVNYPAGNAGDYTELLSSERAPRTRDDWYRFTDNYVPPVPVPVFKGTRLILENGRVGKTMFIRTYRKAPAAWAAFVPDSRKPHGAMR